MNLSGKKTFTRKKAARVVQGVGPEFKPQYHKTNKQNRCQVLFISEIVGEIKLLNRDLSLRIPSIQIIQNSMWTRV
jgi:hypothetical protein